MLRTMPFLRQYWGQFSLPSTTLHRWSPQDAQTLPHLHLLPAVIPAPFLTLLI